MRAPSRICPRSCLLAAALSACATPSGDDTATDAVTDASSTGEPGATTGPTSAPTSEPPATEPTSAPTTDEPTTEGPPPGTDSEPGTSGDTMSGPDTSGETSSGETGDTSTGSETGDTSSSETGESSGDESSTGDALCDDGVEEAAEVAVLDIEAAVEGVLFSSESDYPWTVFALECAAPVTEANVKTVIAPVYVQNPNELPLVDREIEVRSFDEFFDKLTVPEDWWEDWHYMQAEKYAAIRAALEAHLVDLQVFRFGEPSGDTIQGAIDVYVVGATADGDVVGMWTISIET